ncbi:hypothetical protein RhiirA5_467174 [Rhizophagus irregularis]|uniref:DUF8211 domain-containing protein n=1 Tax=Rhizophagus irregularis TaxID=588596 RepID=A0A2N0NSX6_9GLOM|nr:hypothetical protein RhiirA5_467174 [Rhizophagus irregularis]
MKEDKLAAGRRYCFLFQESQHIYSPVHHLKFKRHPKEKLLPDPDDYTFNIPHHSLNNSRLMPIVPSRPATSHRPSGDNTIPHYLDVSEIAALKGFLEPLCKSVPLIRGHNPVDPTKLNSHYYLQYDPDHPDLPPDIRLHRGNRQDLDANDANYIGTMLKHFYRRALTSKQIMNYTDDFHEFMNQPPPPPKPSKKKQCNKWKKWMEKHQRYDDFMSKPYTYVLFAPETYHQELFGPAHLDLYTSDDTKAVEHRPSKRDTSTNPSIPSTSLNIKRPRPADSFPLPDFLSTSLNSN